MSVWAYMTDEERALALHRKGQRKLHAKQRRAGKKNKRNNWRKPTHEQRKRMKMVESIRRSKPYRKWRAAVMRRDEHKCVSCRSSSNLQVDHLKGLSAIVRSIGIASLEEAFETHELWDTSNGQTLCRSCHKKKTDFQRLCGWHNV